MQVGEGSPDFDKEETKLIDDKKGDRGNVYRSAQLDVSRTKHQFFLTLTRPNHVSPVWAEVTKRENDVIKSLGEGYVHQETLPARKQYGDLGIGVILRTNYFHLIPEQRTEIFKFTVAFKADEDARRKAELRKAKEGLHLERSAAKEPKR